MSENFITNISRDLKVELETMVQQILISKGLKKDSDLVKTIEFRDDSRTALQLWVNDYYQFVSSGRRGGAKKVPIYALINWIKKNNIKNRQGGDVNSTAFAIQQAIYVNGIKGKNFIQIVEDSVTDTVEAKISEDFEQLVSDSIVKALKFNGKFISSK